MRLYVEEDYAGVSGRVAELVGAVVMMKPDCVLGLATGSTPIGAYEILSRKCKERELDFSRVKTVNLDEYCGLAPDHHQSYRHFMDRHLFSKINIDRRNTHVPDGLAADKVTAGAEYDKMIQAMGFTDLQLLGLGENGQIGFNEPGELVAGTHEVQLTKSTIEANARLFADISEVPRTAITMGLWGIMTSRKVLLVACGEKKADCRGAGIHPATSPRSDCGLRPGSHAGLTDDIRETYGDRERLIWKVSVLLRWRPD